MNRLTKEQIMQIPEKRNAGMTDQEIADEFKVSRTTISYWVKRLRESGHEIKRFGRNGRKPMELK